MVKFCTNCGTKLEKEDLFCIKCGTKVNQESHIQKSSINPKQCEKEKKKAIKKLDEITGKHFLSENFKKELSKCGLERFDGNLITGQLRREINNCQIKSENLENRMINLMFKRKLEQEGEYETFKAIGEFKVIEELFESNDIKSKIKENYMSFSQLISIKNNLYHEIKFKKGTALMIKLSNEEIKTSLNKELQNVIDKNKEKKIIGDFDKDRSGYFENMIKESCPNIRLTSFEKKEVENISFLDDKRKLMSYKERIEKLNVTAKNIIDIRKKIGKYDFVGILIEDGGFINKVDIISLQKNLRKAPSYCSYVFVTIFENNIKLVGTESTPPCLNTRTGIDRVIFFKDMISLGYSNGEITFNLSNNEKLRLKPEYDSKSNVEIKKFYNSLFVPWENFKNNEQNTITEKEDFNSADQLLKYAELYEKGIFTEEEFNAVKKKLLGL